MRALVSYVPNDTAEFLRLCAENAHEFLAKDPRWCQPELINDSVAAQFRFGAQVPCPPRGPCPAPIESYELTIHIAHGNQSEFLVSERVPQIGEGRVRLSVDEIAPGKDRARYLWLIACEVMAHGPNEGREPNRFNEVCTGEGPVGEANFFARWGKENPRSRTLPLGNDLRMVCGGSTLIWPTHTLLAPVFRLISQGFMLADAFIMGLVRENQTPLCATLANEDRSRNPLYDSTWSTQRNSGGDRLYIQYPIRGGRFEKWTAEIPQPRLALVPLPNGYEPSALPVLEARVDAEAQELFATIADEIGESGAIRAEHRYDEGTLLVYSTEAEAGPSPQTTSRLARLLSSMGAVKPRIDSSRLSAESNQGEIVVQQIDHFPVDRLPTDDMTPFPRCLVVSEEKCRYLAAVARFRDRENSDAVYETLDPDLSLLLRYEADAESGLPARGIRLLARGWRFEEASGRKKVLDIAEAKRLAWGAIAEGTEPEGLEKLDWQNPSVAIGYRLHSSDGKPSLLQPHYAVTFPYLRADEPAKVETPAPTRGVTVETPALVD